MSIDLQDTVVALMAIGDSNVSPDQEAETLIKLAERIQHRLDRLADERPPIKASDLFVGGNIKDRAFKNAVEAYKTRHPRIDTSILDRDDVEAWEHIAGGESDRYEVREIPIDPDFGDPEFMIYDTERDVEIFRTTDRDEAVEECERENRADGQQNLHGFPFAQNVGFQIEMYEAVYFAAAGFIVYQYGDEVIAGIDGGGYDMLSQHWAPLYFNLCRENDWRVETDKGPRIVKKAE